MLRCFALLLGLFALQMVIKCEIGFVHVCITHCLNSSTRKVSQYFSGLDNVEEHYNFNVVIVVGFLLRCICSSWLVERSLLVMFLFTHLVK